MSLPLSLMEAFAVPQLSPLICLHSSEVLVCEGNIADRIRLEKFFKKGKDTDHIKLLNEFVLSLIQIYSSDDTHKFRLYDKYHSIAGKNSDGSDNFDIIFYVRVQHLESSPA